MRLENIFIVTAGSDIIETNTYQASVEGFMKHLQINEADSIKLIENAVEITKDAIDEYKKQFPDEEAKKIQIAGSIGPYGAFLHDGSEYTGNYEQNISRKTLQRWHAPRLEALIASGVNLIAIETIPCIKEAEVLIEMIKLFPQVKAWLSFSCKDGESLSNGENFKKAVQHCYDLNPEQIVAVGANCVSPKFIMDLIHGVNDCRVDKIPLIVYPNTGEEFDYQYGWTGKDLCRPLAEYVKDWLDNGVRFIGGCCRTSAADIKEIRNEVDKWVEGQALQL